MKIIVNIFVIIFMPSILLAGPNALVGVFTDMDHSVCRVDVDMLFTPFTAMIWIIPNDNGMLCTSYGLSYPLRVYITESTLNPSAYIPINECDTPQDCTVCFSECQDDWVWLFSYTMLLDAIIVDYIRVVDPISGTLRTVECGTGNPTVPLLVFNYLGINIECPIEIYSTETSSWGVIKQLYSD